MKFTNRFTLMFFLLSLFISSLFAGAIPPRQTESFTFPRGNKVILSVETYKKRDNLVPVTLKLQGLDIRYWLDDSGKVKLNPRSRESAKGIRIDMTNREIELNNHIYPLVVIAENPVRSIFRVGTRSIPMEMRLDSNAKQGRLLLGDRLEPFMDFRAEIKSLSSGFRELQVKSPSILPSCSSLVIDPEKGGLYKVADSGKIRKFELMQKWGQRKEKKHQREVNHEK